MVEPKGGLSAFVNSRRRAPRTRNAVYGRCALVLWSHDGCDSVVGRRIAAGYRLPAEFRPNVKHGRYMYVVDGAGN